MTHVALLRLPWPPRGLSPNARGHWRPKNDRAQDYKRIAWGMALAQNIRRVTAHEPVVVITFHPPDRRRRDLDNCLASMKAALDGIATAWGVDDSRWAIRMSMGEPVKGGCVMVECRDAGVQMIELRGVIR